MLNSIWVHCGKLLKLRLLVLRILRFIRAYIIPNPRISIEITIIYDFGELISFILIFDPGTFVVVIIVYNFS